VCQVYCGEPDGVVTDADDTDDADVPRADEAQRAAHRAVAPRLRADLAREAVALRRRRLEADDTADRAAAPERRLAPLQHLDPVEGTRRQPGERGEGLGAGGFADLDPVDIDRHVGLRQAAQREARALPLPAILVKMETGLARE